MAECVHGRTTVLNILERATSKYTYWREECNHCGKVLLCRDVSDALPERVLHHQRTHRLPHG